MHRLTATPTPLDHNNTATLDYNQLTDASVNLSDRCNVFEFANTQLGSASYYTLSQEIVFSILLEGPTLGALRFP